MAKKSVSTKHSDERTTPVAGVTANSLNNGSSGTKHGVDIA